MQKVKKYCTRNSAPSIPIKFYKPLIPYINEPFADSLVVKSCRYNPTAIYNIAQAPDSKLGKLIHRNKSPIVNGRG